MCGSNIVPLPNSAYPDFLFAKTPEKPQILCIEETLEEAALIAFGVKKADAFPDIPRRIFLPF